MVDMLLIFVWWILFVLLFAYEADKQTLKRWFAAIGKIAEPLPAMEQNLNPSYGDVMEHPGYIA